MTAPDLPADEAPRPEARRKAITWLVFPGLTLLLFAGLVALDLNGSSISLLVPRGDRDGLLLGQPRSVRSDEWRLRTPIAISSVEQDFPGSPWIGLAAIDQAAASHGGPTLDWSTAFKPQDWGYLVLGASRGLSFSWWWSFVVSLLGCFGLFGVVTRSPWLAALLSIGATFTPYSAWWTSPSPALFIGYAAAIGALLITAWSAARWRVALAWTLPTAALIVAFALALYPPWQVSLAWVVALLCLGVALDRRSSLARMAVTTAGSAGMAAAILIAWYLAHTDAITAVAGTIYPGQRVAQAGSADPAFLLDAPLGFWMAGRAGATMGTTPDAGPFANLSEAASTWLSLPVLAVVAAGCLIVLFAELQDRRTRGRQSDEGSPTGPVWTLTMTSLGAVGLLAWAFLPVPDVVGAITLLDRVEPSRVIAALGLAALLQVAAASMIRRRPRTWSAPWLIGAAILTGATTFWAHQHLPWDASIVRTSFVVISGVLVGACFALMVSPRWVKVGAASLAVVALTSWSLVNPLQHGLGGVVTDPLVTELRSLTAGTDNPRVEVFGDFTTIAKVRIAGLQSLSGTTLYPDAELMARLTPSQKVLWNNYAQYLWSPLPSGSPAAITQVKGTQMNLDIDPCDPVLLEDAHPGWVVSDRPLDASCLTEVKTVQGNGGQEFQIYRVTGP